ncbi:MAG: amidohydrolase family protein [Chloroflexi bacterium]|nr:amidohydrolase family protein [Chloroflexota bacterium]
MIIDCHSHIFPPEIIAHRASWCIRDAWFGALYASPKARLSTAEDLIASMDKAQVTTTCVHAFGWKDTGAGKFHNAYLLDSARRFPGRILSFAYATPHYIPADLALFSGIGEWMPDGQGFSLAHHQQLASVLEAAYLLDLPVLIHTSELTGHYYPGKGTVYPQLIVALASAFPNNQFIAAHWGGGLPFYELMPEVRDQLKRVFYDTAASSLLYDTAIYPLIEQIGLQHKVLWGSDFPLIRQERDIARIHNATISATFRGLLLGTNAYTLLSRFLQDAPSDRAE